MAYGVINVSGCAAAENDAYIRKAVSATALENGMVCQLASVSSTAGEEDVFVATAPASGAGLTNLWMVAEPPLAKVTNADGTKSYLGLDPDPRDYIAAIGDIVAVIQLHLGDILVMSADAIAGTISTNQYAVATDSDFQLNWAASAVSGVTLKLLGTTYISIPDGTIGTQRVTAYRLEVVALS